MMAAVALEWIPACFMVRYQSVRYQDNWREVKMTNQNERYLVATKLYRALKQTWIHLNAAAAVMYESFDDFSSSI